MKHSDVIQAHYALSITFALTCNYVLQFVFSDPKFVKTNRDIILHTSSVLVVNIKDKWKQCRFSDFQSKKVGKSVIPEAKILLFRIFCETSVTLILFS